VLCSLLWVTLLGQGVGLGDPQRALPAPAMLGFFDSVPQFTSLQTKALALRWGCQATPPGRVCLEPVVSFASIS